ncbi:MAG: hypothetical protein AAF349_21580, partial [Cyanobacteria bacterium P01_A01_bin.68]
MAKRNIFEFEISALLRVGLLILLTQFNLAAFALHKTGVKQLTRMGHEQLEQGRAEEALQTWQKVTDIYRTEGNSIGVSGSLINQSLALKALGSHYRACQLLIEVLKIEDLMCVNGMEFEGEEEKYLNQLTDKKKIENPRELQIKIIGLNNLGEILRLTGKPRKSEIILLHALELGKKFSNSSVTNQILLSLANTERILYKQARNKYLATSEVLSRAKAESMAESRLERASKIYTKVIASSKEDINVLKTRLNQLSLSLEYIRWSKIKNNSAYNLKDQKLQQYIKQLLFEDFEKLPPIESIYGQINFAKSLIAISKNTELNENFENIQPLSVALSKSIKAYSKAKRINNKRAMSQALETIGDISNYQGKIIDSKKYLLKALSLAKSIQAEDITYRLQQKLGKLYQKTNSIKSAEKMYLGAINSLDKLRNSIMSTNPEFQFSFKDKVEPVYREYMELLLSQASPNFSQVIKTYDNLKLAELENFLQCGKLNT